MVLTSGAATIREGRIICHAEGKNHDDSAAFSPKIRILAGRHSLVSGRSWRVAGQTGIVHSPISVLVMVVLIRTQRDSRYSIEQKISRLSCLSA
jgi:hypothetical protein